MADIFTDNFDRADGPLGGTWITTPEGNVTIAGGRAVSVTEWDSRALVDIGVTAGYRVAAVFNRREWPSLAFRFIDGWMGSYFIAWSNPNIELIRKLDGTDTILQSGPSPSGTDLEIWAEVREVAGGTEITWGHGTTTVGTYTDTLTGRPATELVGVSLHPGVEADNFAVTTLEGYVPPDPGDPPVEPGDPGAMEPGSTSVLHPHYLNTGSVFQRDVRNMPLAANSSQIAANIRAQQASTGYYTGCSIWQYNFPSYVIDSAVTPDATVTWKNNRGWEWTPEDVMAAAFGPKPIPEDAVPAAGTDAALVVYDVATDTMWEWWQMEKTGPGQWAAEWGSRTLNANNNFTNQAGVGSLSASGLNGVLGQIGIGEVRAGKINHALIFALPNPGIGHSWPAKQNDGNSSDPNAPLEGQWGRLDPAFDVETLDNELLRLVARAAQRYGIVPVDRAGSVSFCGESGAAEEAATGVNPWTEILATQGNGKADWEVLHGFPWESTQWAPVDWMTEAAEVIPDSPGTGNPLPEVVIEGVSTGHLAHHGRLHQARNTAGGALPATVAGGGTGHLAHHSELKTWYDAAHPASPLPVVADGASHASAHQLLHVWINEALPEPPNPGFTVGDSILHPVYLGEGSVFQRDVSAMPLATNSAAMAAYMRQDQINTGYGTAWNLYQYNFPTYVVRSSQTPPAHVTWRDLRAWGWTPVEMMGTVFSKGPHNPELDTAPFAPIPEYAVPATGTDSSMAVYDADSDTLWEWWQITNIAPGQWAAEWGSRTLNASQKFNGQADVGSVCAAGLMGSLLQIGIGEAQAGVINHALGLVMLAPAQGHSWPARQDDGWVTDPNAPIQGQWFRLDPAFDIEAQPYNELLKMVCRAVQTYGATCFDKGGAVAWTGESSAHEFSTTGVDPWQAILADAGGGLAEWQVFNAFPWEQTQWAPVDWGKP